MRLNTSYTHFCGHDIDKLTNLDILLCILYTINNNTCQVQRTHQNTFFDISFGIIISSLTSLC